MSVKQVQTAFGVAVGLLLLVGLVVEAEAHPQTGIVVDRAGNVYFSDLETIWKIDTKGKLIILRQGERGRHVHELSIDEHDQIYGADISYQPATDKWITAVWKIAPEGKLTYLVAPTNNPPRGVSMSLDRAGNMYSVDQNNHLRQQTLLLRRTPGGEVTTLAGGAYGQVDGTGTGARFSKVGGLYVTADGTSFLTDGMTLRKVSPDGKVTTIVRNLDFKTSEDDPRLFATQSGPTGLSIDPTGNIFVADAPRRRLLKITPQGDITVLLRTEAPYFPSGVTNAAGNLYVLELGLTLPNATSPPRVRKITPDGKSLILATVGSEKGEQASTLGTTAGVTTERALVFLTRDGRTKYVVTALAVTLVAVIGVVLQARRRRKAL